MRSRLPLAAALLVAATVTAHAQRTDVDWNGWGRPLTPLGWSEDGEYFAFTKQVEYYPLETIDDESIVPLKLVFGVVHEARTGRQSPYVLELSDEHGRAIRRDELAHQPGPEAWRAWLAAHPLVMQRGRTAGRAEARVSGTVGDGARADMPWQRGRFHFALPSGQPVRLALEVVVDGRVWRSLATGEGDDGFVGQAEPLWSPDGRRVAWWLEQSTEDDAHGPTQYVVIAALGPRVELVVSPEAEALAGNAIDQLEAAGVAPVFVSGAGARIERSVVRVAAGREDEARKLAARLPGAPEVEALSVPSLFDFSVVAGPELMQPVPSRPPRVKFRDLMGVRSPVARRHLLVGVLAAVGAVLLAWLWMRLESARLLRRTQRPRQ